MKASPITLSLPAIALVYLAGFGLIRAKSEWVVGPAAGANILVPPQWYGSDGPGRSLAYIYWPMFYLEQKITGEDICGNYTKQPKRW